MPLKFVIRRWTKNLETGEKRDEVFRTGYKTMDTARIDSISLNNEVSDRRTEYYYADIIDEKEGKYNGTSN